MPSTSTCRHGRKGHLYENRFRAWVICDEPHLHSAIEYVVLNPVRGGLCEKASDWPWSWPRVPDNE